MKKRIECRIEGRVQMVMYRDFATRTAQNLGLVGIVANNADGTVSFIAEGEEESLHEMIGALRKGSLLAHVLAVEVTWKEVTGEFSSFTISYE